MNQTLNDYVSRRTEELSTALAVRPPEQAQRQAMLVRGGATGVGALIAMTVLAASGAGGFAMFAMGGLLLCGTLKLLDLLFVDVTPATETLPVEEAGEAPAESLSADDSGSEKIDALAIRIGDPMESETAGESPITVFAVARPE